MEETQTPEQTERAAAPERSARVSQATRHANGLTSLMAYRADLRGVHEFADFVDESVRWTA